ncbi:MAG: response regulator, partial [Nitrospirota bacterium]
MPCAVLIIEDEVTLSRNMKAYLERYNYDVRTAGSGEEGLQQFDSFKPDVVVLDFQLPGVNGLEILSRIRGIDPHIIVIMVTAYGNVQVAVDAMKAGAYDYLSKPLILGELKLLLDKAVGQTRMQGT